MITVIIVSVACLILGYFAGIIVGTSFATKRIARAVVDTLHDFGYNKTVTKNILNRIKYLCNN